MIHPDRGHPYGLLQAGADDISIIRLTWWTIAFETFSTIRGGERLVQQHLDVRLVLQPFGFGLLLRQRKLVVAETDRDLS